MTAAVWRYAGVMRYPDGGGLTAAERARREAGAGLQGGLRCRRKLTPRSSCANWRRCWRPGLPAWGWQDQCWTLARIAELVYERFKMNYTLAGLDLLLHRLGWSVQVGVRQMQDRPGLLDGYLVGTDSPFN